MTLRDKIAVITGGAGDIGLATARKFLDEGISGILLVDIEEEKLKSAIEKLNGGRVFYFVADVSNAGASKAYIDKAIDKFGRIDILFLDAGKEEEVKSLTDYQEEVFDNVLGVHVKGIWLGLKYAFPYMQKYGGGSVIINSSTDGLKETTQLMANTTKNHCVLREIRVKPLEGKPNLIRVNSILPKRQGNKFIKSSDSIFSPWTCDEVKKGYQQRIPLECYATNEDIAGLVTFLGSDDSKYISGATYVVDRRSRV
jgi:NAD(P)-dependent dehydrogenase (short-subunit alcohol dehydrogenase family)